MRHGADPVRPLTQGETPGTRATRFRHYWSARVLSPSPRTQRTTAIPRDDATTRPATYPWVASVSSFAARQHHPLAVRSSPSLLEPPSEISVQQVDEVGRLLRSSRGRPMIAALRDRLVRVVRGPKQTRESTSSVLLRYEGAPSTLFEADGSSTTVGGEEGMIRVRRDATMSLGWEVPIRRCFVGGGMTRIQTWMESGKGWIRSGGRGRKGPGWSTAGR